MSETIFNLVELLIEELYSKEVAGICKDLILNGDSNIYDIVKRTSREFSFVRDSLITLLQNRLVKVIDNSKSKDWMEYTYSLDINMCLNVIRYPKILYFINIKFGQYAKEIVEHLMMNGVLTSSQIVECVEGSLGFSSTKQATEINNVRRNLLRLLEENIIVRSSNIAGSFTSQNLEIISSSSAVKKNSSNPMKVESNKKGKNNKKASNIQMEVEQTELEHELETIPNVSNGNNDLIIPEDHYLLFDKIRNEEHFFCINLTKVSLILKYELILDIISKKVSQQVGLFSRVMIERGNFSSETLSTVRPLSCTDITTAYPELYKLNIEELIKQLKGSENNLIKVYGLDETGKEVFLLDLNEIYVTLKSKLVEKVISQILSNYHSRIYRVLARCGPLDLKNIMDICMISQKESSLYMNQLITMGFIEIQEINIKGSNVLFFKINKVSNQDNLKSLVYKIILNLKHLLRKKKAEIGVNDTQLSQIYGLIAELDSILILA